MLIQGIIIGMWVDSIPSLHALATTV